MTNEEKLAVLNSMQIIETDSDGETLFYVLVAYNEENLDKLEQVVPDVEQYLADYGDPDGDKTAIEISNAAWNHAGANWFTGDAFIFKEEEWTEQKLDELFEVEKFKKIGKEKDHVFQALAFLGEASSKLSIARTILKDNNVVIDPEKMKEMLDMQTWVHDFSTYLRSIKEGSK